jgi:uncharacterized membrane protein
MQFLMDFLQSARNHSGQLLKAHGFCPPSPLACGRFQNMRIREMSQNAASSPPVKVRLGKLDVLRGIALIAMATYHTTWDFEFFGYLEPGSTGHGPLKLYARCIASTFLILVGFSLVLAHGRGIRWRHFAIRLGQIIIAALAITIATYLFTPDSFVFFGILHEIAAASLLGLLFLRLPALITAIAAACVIAAPHYLASSAFDAPWLWPLGLSGTAIRSNDFVPLFPWFGAVLAGMALAKTLRHFDMLQLFAGNIKPDWLDRGLRFIGRHSLAFYLIHQPVLIGCVYLISQIFPASLPASRYTGECIQSCAATYDKALCENFCGCVVDRFQAEGIFTDALSGKRSPQTDPQMQEIQQICLSETGQ